jgi:nitrate/nitrite transporter NarK
MSRSVFNRVSKYVLDPRRAFHNFFLHSLLCLFAPGILFHDAIFASLQSPLLEWLQITHGQFGLLYSIPTLLGVVSAPTASLVLRFGATRVILVSGFMVFLGILYVGQSVKDQAFHFVLIGRLWFTVFHSTLSSVASLVTFRLFKEESSRALAYSFIIFFNRVGAISGFFFSGRILESVHGDVVKAVWISIVPTGVCLFASVTFAYFYRGTNTARLIRPLLQPSRRSRPADSGDEQESSASSCIPRALHESFWILFLLIGCLYGTILPFETIAVSYFQESYGLTPVQAGSVLSLCPSLALFSPLFSSFIYTAKYQLIALVFGTASILCSVSFMYFQVFYFSATFLMLMLGVGYMIGTNTVWVLVPQLVQGKEKTTLAVGVSGMSSSLFISMSNFIVGYLRDLSNSYSSSLLYFMILASIGLFCSIRLVGLNLSKQDETGSVREERVESVTRISTSTERTVIMDSHFS